MREVSSPRQTVWSEYCTDTLIVAEAHSTLIRQKITINAIMDAIMSSKGLPVANDAIRTAVNTDIGNNRCVFIVLQELRYSVEWKAESVQYLFLSSLLPVTGSSCGKVPAGTYAEYLQEGHNHGCPAKSRPVRRV